MKTFHVGLILLAASTFPAVAQTWDNTGNKLLNGRYYFREVTLTSAGDAYAAYGTIIFSNGTYTLGSDAVYIQASTGLEQAYTTGGSYSLAASGFGFINNSLIGSPIYGLVGANGVFVGSITETNVNDIFIAAPVSAQNAGTLSGPYSIAYADPLGALTGGTPFGALLTLNSSGGGSIGSVNVSAYVDTSTPQTQSISGVSYTVSNNAFVVSFPANNNSTNLVQGQEFLYSTPDGSFVFGGSPQNFDMLVGVRTNSTGTFGGLYYSAGLQIDNSSLDSSGQYGVNTYYGSFNANNGVILGHQRVEASDGNPYGFTYSDVYTGTDGNYTDDYLGAQFISGVGGDTQISVGIGPYPGISVAVRAPSFSGSGVYLSPTGIVSNASFSPFTAGVSPCDVVILEGNNLGPATLQGASSLPLPTNLANVKVLINNIEAPISYVSSHQIAALVPYDITDSVAQFQVNNNGQLSNVITEYVNLTTPGVFTQDSSGSGYAAALHKNGSLVTPDSPAEAGETVAVYMSGLGTVFPAILDGVGAPSNPPSTTSSTFVADISGTTANIAFEGLAPGFAGLYQVNIQIPTGLTSGDNAIGIGGPDSYNSEAFISVGSSGAVAAPAAHVHKKAVRRRGAMRKSPFANRGASVPVTSTR
jgi:uncharacterized protein (TIGR03437 family)